MATQSPPPIDGKKLQRQLLAAGYSPGPIDGDVQRRTYEAFFCYMAGRDLGDVGRELAISAETAFPKYGITTPLRLAHLVGQICNETGGFKAFTENLNYSTVALLSLFGRHRISVAQARELGRAEGAPALTLAQQEKLANVLYGGEWGRVNLGNTQPGDGWRYRGRGGLHLTGRGNYARSAKRLGVAIDIDPDLVAKPAFALTTALDFWERANVNDCADRDDVVGARKITNGGTIGLAEVERLIARAKAVLL